MSNVTEFGAAGDGKTNDAKAIDAAIAACGEVGGGIVHFANQEEITNNLSVS
jgi:polygalacturonase